MALSYLQRNLCGLRRQRSFDSGKFGSKETIASLFFRYGAVSEGEKDCASSGAGRRPDTRSESGERETSCLLRRR